jgi:NAD(P)-dependent dehydrogenase (short-subunit alcohol dehydrogenase family)
MAAWSDQTPENRRTDLNKIIIVTGASSGFGLMAAQSAFIKGTNHFPHAGAPADQLRAEKGVADRVGRELLRRMGLEDLLSPSHELRSGRI